MAQKIIKLFQLFKNKFEFSRGLFSVFGANIISKLLLFGSNIIIVNILTKTSYGMFSIANNIFSLFILFSSFGLESGVFQFTAEKRLQEDKDDIYSYGFWTGFLINFFLSFLMFLYGTFGKESIDGSGIYIQYSALLPVAYYLFQYTTIILRTKKDVTKYAISLGANSALYAGLSILGAIFFGVSGLILGRYFSFLFAGLLALYYLRNELSYFIKRKSLESQLKKDIWFFSIKSNLVSIINQIVFVLDVFLITKIIQDANAVATYKVASIIPTNLLFIPSSIAVFIIPYFAENIGNKNWLKKAIKKIYFYVSILNLILCLSIILTAPFIVNILWGKDYYDSIKTFQILTITYFFNGTFRLLSTNILASQRKVQINLVIGIITMIVNIVSSYFLISKYGILGAAISTLVVMIVTSFMLIPQVINIVK